MLIFLLYFLDDINNIYNFTATKTIRENDMNNGILI